ncbi:DUF3592 domain-containing protein [Enterococcus nangangensis]|uniref:DUF3592 domain-containing protein n=1 Tax=Enterococcus nangangensis TaxID=2559926 RepID=UPI0010FA5D8B|nr:DUF3592 domain-containing protein [Enterococcus nangangensis]
MKKYLLPIILTLLGLCVIRLGIWKYHDDQAFLTRANEAQAQVVKMEYVGHDEDDGDQYDLHYEYTVAGETYSFIDYATRKSYVGLRRIFITMSEVPAIVVNI